MGRADIALRHITHQYPEDLARALLPPGLRFEILGWFDSQLTMLERRLDEALDLRVGGSRRLLHIELELDLANEDIARLAEYRALLLSALRVETSRAPCEPTRSGDEGRTEARAPVPVHSVVIVLRGRKEPWPEAGAYGTDWPELPWSGMRFRVEAVYQRTVAELRARGGLLWLVFTPLARDASAAAMQDVIEEIQRRVPEPNEARAALYTALLVMAEIDPWGYDLGQEIKEMIYTGDLEIFALSPTLRAAFENGQQSLLHEAFAAQEGRAPTPEEEAALVKRTREVGAKQALRALFKLHGDALAEWLLGNAGGPVQSS
jgi:hypothetical protein